MADTTKKLIEGIITPMITSVSDRKHIDFDGQGRLLDRIVAGGVNGAFILGTTGEGCSLSERMKQELIEFTVSHARGRVPVFVHIADCCLENSIALASFAERKNADYLVCALPFYFGLTQEEIYRYYIALADNVALPLFYQGVGRKKRNELAMEYLDKLGLKEWAHHLPNELSGGQKQRVAIARALISKPQIILADEPTGALDSKTSVEVMNILKELHDKEGLTIVVVTHESGVANQTNKIIHIKDGVIERIEDNIDHNASPFGKNGFMK